MWYEIRSINFSIFMGHFSFRKGFIFVALILYWAFLWRQKSSGKKITFKHIHGNKSSEQLIKMCYHVAIARMFADRIKRTSRDLWWIFKVWFDVVDGKTLIESGKVLANHYGPTWAPAIDVWVWVCVCVVPRHLILMRSSWENIAFGFSECEWKLL